MTSEDERESAWMEQYRRNERIALVERARRMVRRAERLYPGDPMNPMIRDVRKQLDGLVKDVRAAP